MRFVQDLHSGSVSDTTATQAGQKRRSFAVYSGEDCRLTNKLFRFVRNCKVLARIGEVVYKLDLPETMQVHNVSQVSLLNLYLQIVGLSHHPLVRSLMMSLSGNLSKRSTNRLCA